VRQVAGRITYGSGQPTDRPNNKLFQHSKLNLVIGFYHLISMMIHLIIHARILETSPIFQGDRRSKIFHKTHELFIQQHVGPATQTPSHDMSFRTDAS
jgi:hypothetical protein